MPNQIFSNNDNYVYGVGELVQKLNAMPDKLRNRGLRRAVSAAATPIVKATKASMVTERTGLLKQSISKVVLKSYKNTAGYVALIGARRMTGIKTKGVEGIRWVGKKARKRLADLRLKTVYPTRYLHLYEKGTSHSRAFHPMERGLQQAKDIAFGVMRTKLTEFIETEATK